MAVTATVVADPLIIATIANIFVPAQSRCPAFLQSVECSQGKALGLTVLNLLASKSVNWGTSNWGRTVISEDTRYPADYVLHLARFGQSRYALLSGQAMQIEHRCCDVGMSQQLFDGNDVHSILEQISSITVAQRMKRNIFFDVCFF